jgi:hypothetical protein
MKKRLVTIALSAVMMFGLLGAAAPAQAHFVAGGNCHILRVSANGTVTFRITNRLYDPAQIYCGLRFNDGDTGYYRTNVRPRDQVIRRWNYGGSWTTVRIVHVHVTRL